MVQKKIKHIIWFKIEETQYYKILEYLFKKAPQAIDLVANKLLDILEKPASQYNNFPPYRFKKNKDGSFKTAIVFSYRISYQVTDNNIINLHIRYTSRKPLNY